jgi:maleylacetoacetate isomerase
MVFTMPAGHPVTEALGTPDLEAFNPEGRIPVLLLPDGRIMTQSGPIIDFIEAQIDDGESPLLPNDPWEQAEVKRIMWIIAADVQPYQNIPFIIQAMGDWDMVKAPPTTHPLRLHYIRREFGALEGIMCKSPGHFSVGNTITLADCFIVPQIRNALLAGIDLENEFPIIYKVFNRLLEDPNVKNVVEDAGGVVQPLAFDAEKFEMYHKTLRK